MQFTGKQYHFICSLLISFLQVPAASKSRIQQKLILISFDGFRWDFKNYSDYKMENLHKLIHDGVTVDYVRNVFPTVTSPNHQSIITGLYPENHGIIDNTMFDENNGTRFEMFTEEERWWNQATPIWVTNQRNGFKSAVCYWPGSHVRFNGTLPSFSLYDGQKKKSLDFKERVDKAVDWMENNDDVTFAALYFHQPDETTHEYGAESNITLNKNRFISALSQLDMALGYLTRRLNQTYLLKETNIIIIGDHGSVNTTYKRVINLDDYINVTKTIRSFIGMTFSSIWPKRGHLKEIYAKLKDKNPHMKVYLKKDIPEHFHIKKNDRTAPIILLPDPGWVITTKFQKVPYLEGKFSRGEHGYSNLCRDMNPGFAAAGPAFKRGAHTEWIETVDLYPLMCHILGIKPLQNDGKLERTEMFLNEDN